MAYDRNKISFPEQQGISFIENNGQWVDSARFKADIPGGVMFITDQGFVYNYVSMADIKQAHDSSNTVIHQHAFRVNFSGANQRITYRKEEKRETYHNYFIGNDRSKWAGHVGLYGKVLLQNIYPGIDMAIHSLDGSLKYDFIVAPGADPSQILLTFEGVAPELTGDGHLKIVTSVNEITEQAPYTYQLIDGREVAVKSGYRLANGQLKFTLPNGYDTAYPLIIDPVLVFSTYSGSRGEHHLGSCTTYDAAGNLYLGAYSTSPGWPVTLGAFQSDWKGGVLDYPSDIAINKYNASGTRLLYSTYYGGSSNEQPHALYVNEQDELILGGSTMSLDLPVTTGCFDSTFNNNGVYNVFLTHFNTDGTALIGATYIGGVGATNLYHGINFNQTTPLELIPDNIGNIWVVACTEADDFPVTVNAEQNTKGGELDGVLFKLNAQCSQLIYSSFLGGGKDDAIASLAFNHAGNLVLCGSTGSSDFPTTIGVMYPNPLGGHSDGFVSIIDPETGRILKSTFIGTDTVDDVTHVQIDQADNVYVLGRTLGNYPVTPGVYSSPSADVFIDKLKPDLSGSLLSTRIGSKQQFPLYMQFFPSSFLLDECDNIFVTGIPADSSLPITDNAFQQNLRTFWFCVLTPGFSTLKYATYFGSISDHLHNGVHRLSPKGIVYHSICANAATGDPNNPYAFPATPNAYARDKKNGPGGSYQDALSFKFSFENLWLFADFTLDTAVNRYDTGCLPYTVKMLNRTSNSDTFSWDFGDGSTMSDEVNPTHTYTKPGVYTIKLYAFNDTFCITSDTAYMTVVVIDPQRHILANDTTVCAYDQAIDIGVNIGNPGRPSIAWGPAQGILSDPNRPRVTVNLAVNSTYYVNVIDSIARGCVVVASDTVHIHAFFTEASLKLGFQAACSGAANGSIWIGTAPGDTAVYKYSWRSEGDTAVLSVTDTLMNVPAGYYLVYVNVRQCDTILRFYLPEADSHVSFTVSDSIVCMNEEVSFTNTSSADINNFLWLFGDGDSYDDHNTEHSYSPGSYKVMLIGGICNDTAYQNIIVDSMVTVLSFNTDRDSICEHDALTFTSVISGHNNTGFRWAFGDGSEISTGDEYVRYAYDTSGVMAVSLTMSFRACPDITHTDTINVYTFPKLNLGRDSGLCLGNHFIVLYNLLATAVSQQYWNTGDVTDRIEVRHPGIYALTITSAQGCSITDSVEITKDCYIDIPNAFTPDGDGVNDYFFPRLALSKQLSKFRMQVFNRWGGLVFETVRLEGRGWDGKFNNIDQPGGVYIYLIEAIVNSRDVEQYRGNITLLR